MDKWLNRWMPVAYRPLVQAMLLSVTVSLMLFLVRVFGADSFRFGFMFWNLWLAFVPLPLAWLLVISLTRRRWLTWQNLLLTFAWLAFLPNSFYILTDFIHIHLTGEINILFDVVLFFSCVFNAYVFGFTSLYLVHRELKRRIGADRSHVAVALVLAICSFAVYMGRYLRWNSWDVLANPFGVLFDVSDRLTHLSRHPQLITTTMTFFLLLGSIYWVSYQFVKTLRSR